MLSLARPHRLISRPSVVRAFRSSKAMDWDGDQVTYLGQNAPDQAENQAEAEKTQAGKAFR
jgi:hypothetical protein